MQMDINDVRSKFSSKYDPHIQQMLDYYKTIPKWKLEPPDAIDEKGITFKVRKRKAYE